MGHRTIRERAVPALLAALLLLAVSAVAQESKPPQDSRTSDSGMAGMPSGEMHQKTGAPQDAGQAAMDAMSVPMRATDMAADMNPHMSMTSLHPKQPGDDERAEEIVETVRGAINRYKDYHVALADGYRIFLPNVTQKHYHFTSRRYAFKALFTFDPAHPTSLLYQKVNGTYVLEGAMFTAPRHFTEAQLNARVPLSVARWHKHVNLCLPPRGEKLQNVDWNEFGANGSIATKEACQEASGRWIPQVFGWMVHVYPYETDPAKVWAH